MADNAWQFWVDRGGTFTDVIGLTPTGSTIIQKLLSVDEQRYADAAVEGICRILNQQDFPQQIDAIRIGTTAATNALLERGGSPTALITTRGFADALLIGYQTRPNIFALDIQLPKPLYSTVIEADERVDANGNILTKHDRDSIRLGMQELQAQGIQSIAVCFMHAYRFNDHERQVAQIATDLGFEQISMSHEVGPLVKLVSRGDTTVVDAYLSPMLQQYVRQFQRELGKAHIECDQILFMQSNGGLVQAGRFRGKDSVLSGPAGGVVGMVARGQHAGLQQLIGFDMGGTSTDVSLFSETYEFVNHTEIAGVKLRSPMLRVHTIAAGGSSILAFEAGRFQVGPKSAAAAPGPAGYRRGGPLTLTDANVLLGRILPEYFPKVFGPDSDQTLDSEKVSNMFDRLADEIQRQTNKAMSPARVAEGFVRVAVENMANAIKKISVQRGHDPGQFTLCCFGGAGGQHACQVADRLRIKSILIDPLAGVLSAYGIGVAPIRAYRQQTVEKRLSQSAATELQSVVNVLEAACVDEVESQGINSNQIATQTIAHVRVTGTDTTLPISWGTHDDIMQQFNLTHEQRYGFSPQFPDLIIESLGAEATGETGAPVLAANITSKNAQTARSKSKVSAFFNTQWHQTPVFQRTDLSPGFSLTGPAIIVESTGTIIVDPGWAVEVSANLQILLTRTKSLATFENVSTKVDPIMLEVFSQHFMHIAEQMGVVLESTAHSVNIKERLDFSCALFNQQGELVANAPHMPVHLGSMDDSVQTILRNNRERLLAGDVFVSNAPYNGGTHLPDITVITPVPDENQRSLMFLLASRAHHADVGGISPGSMPPDSVHIYEEGVLLDNIPLVTDGQFQERQLRQLFEAGAYPARKPSQNIADLKAQVAANQRGKQMLHEMVAHYGLNTVEAYMSHLQDNAEESVRAAIERLHEGEFEYELDAGHWIRVKITLDPKSRSATVDFAGTSRMSRDNFNAPASICRAAVLYVFRTLVGSDIPLNAGCSRPLKVTIPPGCLLNPEYPAAVVAGNVETSQSVTDALYGALGILAASQGTMNNLTFGTDSYQYYETIGGGSGAGRTFNGTDAVQTHMTNTRLTDPELLEARYPVLIKEFSVRRNSGGHGAHHGGNGVVRKIEFREEMSVAILSNHRRIAPFGTAGGYPGKLGKNYINRRDGTIVKLGSTERIKVQAGDMLVIETPGGGGYGAPTAPLAESTVLHHTSAKRKSRRNLRQ